MVPIRNALFLYIRVLGAPLDIASHAPSSHITSLNQRISSWKKAKDEGDIGELLMELAAKRNNSVYVFSSIFMIEMTGGKFDTIIKLKGISTVDKMPLFLIETNSRGKVSHKTQFPLNKAFQSSMHSTRVISQGTYAEGNIGQIASQRASNYKIDVRTIIV